MKCRIHEGSRRFCMHAPSCAALNLTRPLCRDSGLTNRRPGIGLGARRAQLLRSNSTASPACITPLVLAVTAAHWQGACMAGTSQRSTRPWEHGAVARVESDDVLQRRQLRPRQVPYRGGTSAVWGTPGRRFTLVCKREAARNA